MTNKFNIGDRVYIINRRDKETICPCGCESKIRLPEFTVNKQPYEVTGIKKLIGTIIYNIEDTGFDIPWSHELEEYKLFKDLESAQITADNLNSKHTYSIV